MRRVLFSAVLLLACESWADDRDFDARHYQVELDLREAPANVRGTSRVTLLAVTATKELVLDFGNLEVDEVSVNDSEVSWQSESSELRIALPEEPDPGEELEVVVTYHGAPEDGLQLQPTKYGTPSAFADNWPNRAHHWMPVIDRPGDKASFEIAVTADERFDVVANGRLVERVSLQNGSRRTRWSEMTPIPVHCMVVGMTEFAMIEAEPWRGIPVSVWVYPPDVEPAGRLFSRVPLMLDFFSSLVGDYPYRKLALVESSTRFGGMENSNTIFFDEKLFKEETGSDAIVAHELAHQWFGDAVTQSEWKDLWLSEGFATYLAAMFTEHASGRDAFREVMQRSRKKYLETGPKHAQVVRREPDDLFELLDVNSYQKAAWILHMLRREIGDAAFRSALRDFYQAHRDGNATTADFQRLAERSSQRSLELFFRQWLDGPGHPRLAVSWRWDRTRREVELWVEQRQPTPFVFPFVVELSTGSEKKRVTMEVRERTTRQKVASDREPERVVFDPDEAILAAY